MNKFIDFALFHHASPICSILKEFSRTMSIRQGAFIREGHLITA